MNNDIFPLSSTNASEKSWRLKYTYGRDVVGYCQLRLTSRCRHPAPGQDLIPLQRLHVFAHSRDPHSAIKLWCQVPFTKSKTIFQIEIYCMQCFLKTNILKVELSMIKISELLRKLWSWRSCFLILPPGALTPQGIEGAMKRDVSKHWCTIQWCASRGWFIAHENWTSCGCDINELWQNLHSYIVDCIISCWIDVIGQQVHEKNMGCSLSFEHHNCSPYVRYFILSKYWQDPVENNQCLERAGHIEVVHPISQ